MKHLTVAATYTFVDIVYYMFLACGAIKNTPAAYPKYGYAAGVIK